jgi:hypothetical protein
MGSHRMHEASKAAQRRLYDPNFASVYFVGDALDIGAGPDGLSKQRYLWPRLTSTSKTGTWATGTRRSWKASRGSRPLRSSYTRRTALSTWWTRAKPSKRWFEVVKPGGYLVTLVPDEDLYEQGVWPSTFNGDHKWTFTPWKASSWSPVSINVVDLIPLLGPSAELVQLQRLERTWNPMGEGMMRWDRTSGPIGESAIEFIVRKRR